MYFGAIVGGGFEMASFFCSWPCAPCTSVHSRDELGLPGARPGGIVDGGLGLVSFLCPPCDRPLLPPSRMAKDSPVVPHVFRRFVPSRTACWCARPGSRQHACRGQRMEGQR